MTSSAEARLAEEEAIEKAKLTTQVLELQNTLEQLSNRVDGMKEDNLKLKSENQVLGQYIENLMNASNVFQSTSAPKTTTTTTTNANNANKTGRTRAILSFCFASPTNPNSFIHR